MENLISVLPILGLGLLGTTLSTAALAAAVALLNKLTGGKREKTEET